MKDLKLARLPWFGLLLVFLFFSGAPVHANVIVSDIKLNASVGQTINAYGNAVVITYLLNEDATLGAAINIYSNGTPVRKFSIPVSTLATNGAGLSRGLNTVTWDGTDNNAQFVGPGNYTVSVTASASGHTNWTLLTTNTAVSDVPSGGYYVYAPRGIAVVSDTNSPYYGRVFVANAATGPIPANAGDQDTILKFNADGSAADDGASGDGGYPMQDVNFSLPQKLRMGGDDRLYMNDYYDGVIVSFDPALTSYQTPLTALSYFTNEFFENPSYYNGDGWFSFDVDASPATNGASGNIWLADYGTGGSGIWVWQLTNGVANPSDTGGAWAVAAGRNCSLGIDATGGFMAATNFNVYASQFIDAAGDTNNRCLLFADASGTAPATNAVWAVGSRDDTFRDVLDTTIDSRATPKYVACAMAGPGAKGIRLLNAANGATVVANLDAVNSYDTTAWDNAGNLYAVSDSLHAWREWSPPGASNSMTFSGGASLKIVLASVIRSFDVETNHVVITFTAAATNALSNFTLVSSTNVAAGYAATAGVVFGHGSFPGYFTVTAPINGSARFYQIKN